LPAVDPLQDRTELPEPPVMVVGDNAQAMLVELAATVRVTVPTKPFSDDTVMVELPSKPTLTVKVVGLAEIAKS
jgi:hypothetical protein